MQYAIELSLIEGEELLRNPWEFQNTHGKLLEMTTSLIFLNVALLVIQLFLMVYHLTKTAHFVPCHKEITAEESATFFISSCYKLHGVSRTLVSDRDLKFVGKFWQSFMGKLNTKLSTSIARHPRTDGLPEKVNQTMQTLLRYYSAESSFD